MRGIVDGMLRPLGLRLLKARHVELLYQHDYKGGYEEYRAVQIRSNKRKIDRVWADERTLSAIAEDIKANGLGANGICHGARNGYEVEWLRRELDADVIGTDISETASQFPNMVTWDFHDENPDWIGKFDFAYTNSLDQAMAPDKALAAWAGQISPKGRIYVEHTMWHSPRGAGEMDPFGAHPFIMPYLFFVWGKERYELADILEIEEKQNNGQRAWVFVLTKK